MTPNNWQWFSWSSESIWICLGCITSAWCDNRLGWLSADNWEVTLPATGSDDSPSSNKLQCYILQCSLSSRSSGRRWRWR